MPSAVHALKTSSHWLVHGSETPVTLLIGTLYLRLCHQAVHVLKTSSPWFVLVSEKLNCASFYKMIIGGYVRLINIRAP